MDLKNDGYCFRIGNFIEFFWAKEGEVFWYLLPTIMTQPIGRHYPGYAKIYIAWLQLYIMIGNLPKED